MCMRITLCPRVQCAWTPMTTTMSHSSCNLLQAFSSHLKPLEHNFAPLPHAKWWHRYPRAHEQRQDGGDEATDIEPPNTPVP